MKVIPRLLILLTLVSLFSCSTKFDINAPEKDITVVFGLLSQEDTVHYIKITKAFIGEEDALIMAQDPALSDYGDVLAVQVEEYSNGTLSRTFNCARTLITNKDTGMFYAPDQYVYAFTANLNTDRRYVLKIVNNETGKEVSAETSLISDFSVTKPYHNPSNPQISFVNSNGEYSISEVKWNSAKNGRIYEPVFRFNYREADLTTHDTVNKYVDWKMGSTISDLLDGGETMLSSYNSESFYKFLEVNIPVDYNKARFAGNIDLIISVGGDELNTYMDLNEPSASIIQERPAYTNISNGIGIFSCRHIKKLSYKLSSFSVSALINGQYTSQLGFQ